MQPYLSYVDSFSFFLNVLLYDEMDFVFDGTVQPRALSVLPPTEEGRSAEVSTCHPRDPSHPGQPSRFQQRFLCSATGCSGDKHLTQAYS